MKENYQVLNGILYHYVGQVVTEERLLQLFTPHGVRMLKYQNFIKPTQLEAIKDYQSPLGISVILDAAVYDINRKLPFGQKGGWIEKKKFLELYTARTIRDLIEYGFIEPSTWDGTMDEAIRNQVGLLDENAGKDDHN